MYKKSVSKVSTLVERLQQYFVSQLNTLSSVYGTNQPFEAVTWLRDEGRFGGGTRYEARDMRLFNAASVNISQVHYESDKHKKLDSAIAISTIIHPQNPYAPSIHMHISWTQMKDGVGYWRMMADLNPSIEDEGVKKRFVDMLKNVSGDLYSKASMQGDTYFMIPVLNRHRGAAHFYLESYHSGNFENDYTLAKSLGYKAIACYISIVRDVLRSGKIVSDAAIQKQLAYHTLYFFQVLTLDRGTTSGLLVHDQNDVGILGSLPQVVNKELLMAWLANMPIPQDKLLKEIIRVLEKSGSLSIRVETKKALATIIRQHYKKYPEALAMQARGDIIPPTVDNHL